MHDYVNSHIEFYTKNYECIGYKKLKSVEEGIQNGDKQYIGNKNKRKCRFCGKENGEVSFKKKAHSIPELLGNKVLLSFDECDDCNKTFSIIESDLSNYMYFLRPITQIRGKGGVPKYKYNDLEIKMGEKNRLEIKDVIDSENVEIIEAEKTITIKGYRNPYIPVNVYKSFVKMALSIMELRYLPYFWTTFDWIVEEDPNKYKIDRLMLFEQFIPGPGHSNIEMFLFKRRDSYEEFVPYCTFVLCIKNFMFQIMLPFAGPDFGHEKFKYVMFPSKYASIYPNGTIETQLRNFSGTSKLSREEVKFSFSYDDAVQIIPKSDT